MEFQVERGKADIGGFDGKIDEAERHERNMKWKLDINETVEIDS